MKTLKTLFLFFVLSLSLTNCTPSREKTPQIIPSNTENNSSNSDSRILAEESEEESVSRLTFNGEDVFLFAKDLDDASAGEIIGDEQIISEEEILNDVYFERKTPEIKEENSRRNLKMVKNSGNFRGSN